MKEIIRSVADNEGTGADSGETVRKALALPVGEQEALFEALGALKSENAGRFLNLLYPSLSDKRLQKLVKRAIFRLKTQGIRVEEPRIAGESALKKLEVSREARVFLTNYDAEQTCVVLAAMLMKKNQFVLSHAVIRFGRGLLEIRSLPVPRDEAEGLLRDYRARTLPPMALRQISPPYGGYLVEEASGLSGIESEEAKSLHHILDTVKGDVRRPGDIYHLDAETAVPASIQDVFADSLFDPFMLDWQGLEEDRKRLDGVINPTIVLPPYVVEERRQAFLDGLVADERLGPLLTGFKRMLEDYAYLFYCDGQFDKYRGLIDLAGEQEGLKKAFLSFVRKTFDKQGEKEQPQPGVIVDPYSLGKK